jgi:hypothetical protein
MPACFGNALHFRDLSDCRRFLARGVLRDGRIVTIPNADLAFDYRTSHPPDGLIFTGAVFSGRPEPAGVIRARMAAVQHHRETAQPIREKTGGSTFRNPPGHSAWKLIDAAGCRGLRVGGAQLSEMHCNFLINTGEATAADIETLGETVRARPACWAQSWSAAHHPSADHVGAAFRAKPSPSSAARCGDGRSRCLPPAHHARHALRHQCAPSRGSPPAPWPQSSHHLASAGRTSG